MKRNLIFITLIILGIITGNYIGFIQEDTKRLNIIEETQKEQQGYLTDIWYRIQNKTGIPDTYQDYVINTIRDFYINEGDEADYKLSETLYLSFPDYDIYDMIEIIHEEKEAYKKYTETIELDRKNYGEFINKFPNKIYFMLRFHK